jgi:hypothetical protein
MDRLSKSWLALKPFQISAELKEPFGDYYQRIQENRRLKHIPVEVLLHWIYDQYDFQVTIKNYAWLDFYEMEFEKVSWPTKNFVGIEILKFYREYVRDKSAIEKIEDFPYDEYWIKNGTWIIPPIVLDVSTLKNNVPHSSKIMGPFQYVDGHTRLGYLRALINISKTEETNLADSHWIFLMQQRRCFHSI